MDLAVLCCEPSMCCSAPAEMGLAPGGKMRQEVYEDPYGVAEWEQEAQARCFVHIANSVTWQDLTGEAPPTQPPTARDYSRMGLPWFDYYDGDAKALEGAAKLAGLASVAGMAKRKGDGTVGDAGGVASLTTVMLGKPKTRHQVRQGAF